ncbi:MAG: helix-turn-helix domain-containing protein [Desulfohalobiaceae bacterium]|nr:helix-turn-helix domain-containing protein [Desulfohalobiaceae bacterium]
MPKNTLSHKALPPDQADRLVQLGQRIRIARKRRRMTLQSLASRMFVDEKTLRRLEKGDPGVSLGVLLTALFCLDLENDLDRVADLKTDDVGNVLDRQRYERIQRVREKKDKKLDF